jgi:Reverse transcriptase (RNA-dependent DNA polymerase)
VQNSKLTEAEKLLMDRELSIGEFDAAIKQCNKKSAPGTDGLSNNFIRKFWSYLRYPLLNYTKCCFEKGALTHLFRVAKIRLIPKKGDKSKIGNWRPISLLNCFYKLISRVFTNRLKMVIDKITNIGQHGYSKKKQCQEVLIGLLNEIFSCGAKNKNGSIISLDIKKAFDSVSHQFLEHALRFFNFGETFIRWIKLLCTNREACIILTGNKIGPNFKLERGNAQGDTISPFLFNICYQILIFKLEFDLQIKSLPDSYPGVTAQDCCPSPDPVSYKTKRIYAFADDCNVVCASERESLDRIKSILTEYSLISGLECNVDKSYLLQIGAINGADPVNVDFPVTQQLKVLGMKISNDLDQDLKTNADFITRKLTDQVTK